MKISPNSTTYVLSYLQDNILSSLTQQQKKILIIASAAFACLAIYYVVRNCCFKVALPSSEENEDDSKKVTSPLAKKEEQKNVSPPKSPKVPKKTEPESPIMPKKAESEPSSKNSDKTEKRTRANGDIEEGSFVEDKLEGKGKITCAYGAILEGEFSQGKLVKGTVMHVNGDVSEGEIKNELLNGLGKLTLKDGTVLKGTFKDGKLEGEGEIQFGFLLDANFCRGNFKDGKLNGNGFMELSNGYKYEGIFEDDQLIDGKITYVNPHDLSSIEGKIKDHRLNGKGKKIYFDGTVDEGLFEDNDLHGQGKRTYSDEKSQETLGERAIEEGVFDCDQIKNGTITWKDGSITKGEFEGGTIFNGTGKNFFLDQIEEGTFKNGFLQGKGKRTYGDGRTIEGEFKDGQLHGYGKITHPNGKIEEGSYDKGKLVPEPADEVINARADIDRRTPREPIYGNYALAYPKLTPFMKKEKEDLRQILLQKSMTFDEAQVIYQANKAKFSAQKFLKILFALLDDKDILDTKHHVTYFANLLKLLRARHQDEEMRMQTRADFGRKILHRFFKQLYPLEKEAESLFKAYFQNLNEEGLADATMLYEMKQPLTANPDDMIDPVTGKSFVRFVSDPSRAHVEPIENRLRKLFNELYQAKKAEIDPNGTLRLPWEIN